MILKGLVDFEPYFFHGCHVETTPGTFLHNCSFCRVALRCALLLQSRLYIIVIFPSLKPCKIRKLVKKTMHEEVEVVGDNEE